MSLLLLDTTFLIDAERGGVDLDDAIDDDDDVAIAAVTVAELLVGVMLASGRRSEARQAYVEELVESLPTIAYDREVAVEHAELLVAVRSRGRPCGAHDLLIAATARATGRSGGGASPAAYAHPGGGGEPMWRLTWVIVGFALLALACDSASDVATSQPAVTTPANETSRSPNTVGTPATTAPPTTAAATVPETASPPVPDAVEVLAAFIDAIERSDADAAFALLGPDAVWSLGEVELRLGERIPPELAWLRDVVGIDGSTVDELVRGVLELQVAMKSMPSVAACQGDGSTRTCDYSVADALTPVVGAAQRGSITVEVLGGHIVRYESDVVPVAEMTGADDAFKRWSAIQNPDVTRELPLLAWANIVVPLAEAWDATGRPDSPAPPLSGDDPVAVVEAFVDARNRGDWETMVAFMGGAALDDPFGSRDEFDATQLLERDITLEECEIALDTTAGVRVGCRVSVTDIIVDAAGITATNPNQSTFQVAGGRVTALPQFIPSSFLAERAIEEWAATNAAESYDEACPDGIAGQSPVDGLACAQFIADNQSGWQPAVGALDL